MLHVTAVDNMLDVSILNFRTFEFYSGNSKNVGYTPSARCSWASSDFPPRPPGTTSSPALARASSSLRCCSVAILNSAHFEFKHV
ncbi:hypothetical protein Mapa_015276 [Marchantia paleacea]|nr:hypothetical protein Mapa_015276 [Marchantia paleacea]